VKAVEQARSVSVVLTRYMHVINSGHELGNRCGDCMERLSLVTW